MCRDMSLHSRGMVCGLMAKDGWCVAARTCLSVHLAASIADTIPAPVCTRLAVCARVSAAGRLASRPCWALGQDSDASPSPFGLCILGKGLY